MSSTDKRFSQSQPKTPTIHSKYVSSPRTNDNEAKLIIPQWQNWKKTMILIVCSTYSFLGNSALVGPAVYIGIYAEEFNITPSTASGLISYPNLAFGFSG
jgi:hypothetical protein